MLTVTHNLGAMVLPLKRVNSTVNRIIYRARGRRECLLVIGCFNVWQCNAPAAAIGSSTMRSIRCGLLLPLHGDLPVRVSVCLFVTTVTPPKTVEPIEDAVYGGNFGRQTRDHLLSGNPDPHGKVYFCRSYVGMPVRSRCFQYYSEHVRFTGSVHSVPTPVRKLQFVRCEPSRWRARIQN